MINLKAMRSNPSFFQENITIPSVRGPQRFGDCMGEFQRERFAEINPALVAIAKGAKPETNRYWWEATKGASKDSDLAVCMLWLLAFSKRPLTCQIGAADKDQADELRKAAKDILRLNPWLGERIQILSMIMKCDATDSTCTILPADVTGSHGARPDVLILNELSHVQKQEFAENLLDNATKVPHGLVVVATNSGFTGTWQERWRDLALDSDRWKTHIYDRPSPWLSDEDIEEAKLRNSKARFNRLWYGIWSPSSGDALDDDDIKAAIKANGPQFSPGSGWYYVAGLDLGIKQDHSALVILGGNRESMNLQLAHAESWSPDPITGKVDLIAVEDRVAEVAERFSLEKVGYDPYQAELMAQRLEARRVRMEEMTFVGANLNLMASTLLDVFRSRRLILFDHPQLIADLGRLTIEEKAYGYRLSATRDETGHADLATALAIALPFAVDLAGKPRGRIGSMLSPDRSGTPYSRALRAHEKLAQQYRREIERNHERGSDDMEEFEFYMRSVGRR